MSSCARLGCLLGLFGGLAASASPASAANIAGNWSLNFPANPTTWTFTQTGTSFHGTTGPIQQDGHSAQYDIRGVTAGPFWAGVVSYSIPGTATPVIEIGAAVGVVSGDSLSGVMASYTYGIVPLQGQKMTGTASGRTSGR